MDQDLQDMIEMSRAAGADCRLVQAGGGNTSVKTDEGRLMFVKASGTSMAQMQEGRGYRVADVAKCLEILQDKSLQEMSAVAREQEIVRRLGECCVDEGEGRPSVETSLHALLGRCVLHTHPSVVNGLLCAAEGLEALQELFGALEPPFLYLQYTDPGYPLAVRLKTELSLYRDRSGCLPEVIFLENHGLFVSAEGLERALGLTRQICTRIEAEWQQRAGTREGGISRPPDEMTQIVAEIRAAMRRSYARVYGWPVLVEFCEGEPVKSFLAQPNARALVSGSALMPDQVVYCKGMPLWLDPEESPQASAEAAEALIGGAAAGCDTPACLLVDGVGLFAAARDPNSLRAAIATMEASLETLSVAACFGGPRGMSEQAVEYIRNWEAEKFRQNLLTSQAKRR